VLDLTLEDAAQRLGLTPAQLRERAGVERGEEPMPRLAYVLPTEPHLVGGSRAQVTRTVCCAPSEGEMIVSEGTRV
jgi:hypothetical protein